MFGSGLGVPSEPFTVQNGSFPMYHVGQLHGGLLGMIRPQLPEGPTVAVGFSEGESDGVEDREVVV